MKKWPCIVDCNIITYIWTVSDLLCWYLFEDIFFHWGLTHRHDPYVILTARFGAGSLRLHSTWSGQYVCHQSYTIFNICFYIIVSLSVVFLPTTWYNIYHNVLHQANQFLFNLIIQKYQYHFFSIKNPRIVPPIFLNQFYKKSTTSFPQEKK